MCQPFACIVLTVVVVVVGGLGEQHPGIVYGVNWKPTMAAVW